MTTEDKALALVNEVRRARGLGPYFECDRTCAEDEALCRAIEQREAAEQKLHDFQQRVSNIVHHYVYADGGPDDWEKLTTLIIPTPKPDPLVAVLHEVDTGPEWDSPEDYCNKIRAALDALGLEIREKSDD